MNRRKNTCHIMILALLTATLLITAAPLSAATIYVKADDSTPDGGGCGSLANPCNTLQAGIDNASRGDTVKVRRGVYLENGISIETRGLTITGNRYARDETIINGQMMCEDNTLTWGECGDFDGDQAGCEATWHSYSGSQMPVSCWYDAGDCKGCEPHNEDEGNCTNTCDSDPFCDDTSLTLIPDKDDECRIYDGTDQTTCEDNWHIGGDGSTSCFWDSAGGLCVGCGPKNQAELGCTNACGSPDGDILTINADRVKVKNLTFLNAEDDGITVSGTAANAEIRRVKIRHADDECVETSGARTSILRSKLRGCDDDGIRSWGDNTVVRGNSISHCDGDGVETEEEASNPTIVGNRFFTIDDDGVETDGKGAVIRNNTFHNVDDDIIDVEGWGFSIVGNEAWGVDDGIEADCTQDLTKVTCLDQTLTKTPFPRTCRDYDGTDEATCEGLWTASNNENVQAASCWWNDSYSECWGCGKHANNDECVNTCVQNTCDDVSLNLVSSCTNYNYTDEATCEANWQIGGHGATGCWWRASDDNCRGCGPENEREGLCVNDCVPFVEQTCGESLIAGNSIRDAVDDECYRISSVGPGLTVEDNTGTFCQDEGMEIWGRKILVRRNTILYSGEDDSDPGFEVRGFGHTFKGNTSRWNHGDGFEIREASGVTFRGNLAGKNFNDGFDIYPDSKDIKLIENSALRNDGVGFEVSPDALDNILKRNIGADNVVADLCNGGTGTVLQSNDFGTRVSDCGPDN